MRQACLALNLRHEKPILLIIRLLPAEGLIVMRLSA